MDVNALDSIHILMDKQGLLFGYCFDIILYGILTVQTYLYYLAFPNDRNITKAVVIFVYTIDTAQTILALHDFYTLFCVVYKNYDIYADAFQSSFLWLTIPFSSALIAAVAQCFYAHRIYILTKKKVVTGIIIIFALVQLGFGVCFALGLHGIQLGDGFLGGIRGAIVWGGIGIICDLIIAVYMTWFLTIQMRRSSWRTTQAMLTRVKRLVLETGLLTVAVAVALALLMLFTGVGFALPGLSLGKVYSNSMLVLLNNRLTIQGGRNEPTFEFEVDSYRLPDVPSRETH